MGAPGGVWCVLGYFDHCLYLFYVCTQIVDSTAQSDARVNTAGTWKNPGQLWIGKERAGSESRDRISRKDTAIKSRGAAQFGETAPRAAGPNRSLELAMYILLVVFGVALAVFVINCAVFVVRRRRRSRSKDSGSSTADVDWVWIGHDALKRNAVSVECMRTLMPAAEFGGGGPEFHHREMMGAGHFAEAASPPPPPLPPKLGRPLSATLSLTTARSRSHRPCSMDPALMESVELQQAGAKSLARHEPRSLARDSTASWPHGRSSMSDLDGWESSTNHERPWESSTNHQRPWEPSANRWEPSTSGGVPSSHELVAYFDGLRESAA